MDEGNNWQLKVLSDTFRPSSAHASVSDLCPVDFLSVGWGREGECYQTVNTNRLAFCDPLNCHQTAGQNSLSHCILQNTICMAHQQATSLNAKAYIFVYVILLPFPLFPLLSSSTDKGRHPVPSNGSPQVPAGNPSPCTQNLPMILLRNLEPGVFLCQVEYSYTMARCTVSRQSILRFGKTCL